jgi:hypothetical protein
MFGPRYMLFLVDDIMLGYFLGLLEVLKNEMRVRKLN